MYRRIRRAYTTFVEQGYTKLTTISCHSELDLLIAKATLPYDVPLPERYVWELTRIFSSSPSLSRTFALSFTRRFGQTKSWRVALKCLLLLHHLLRTLPNNHPFHADLLSARANALISLHPCYFHDESSSYSEEYTEFIHSYAHLIDELMNCHYSNYEVAYTAPPSSLGTFEESRQALELVQQLQSLMDLAMECMLRDPAARSFIIRSAARSFIIRSVMKQVARESFMSYLAARQGLSTMLDSIIQLPYRSCIEGLRIYKKAAEQAVRLEEFYKWCQMMGICGQYEYPLVEKIPKIQVLMLEAFVEQTWQLTESSSASSSTDTVEIQGKETVGKSKEIVISEEWEKFEEESGEEEQDKALIKFEDEASWEVILDASVKWPWNVQSIHEPWKKWGREDEEKLDSEKDDKILQLFNPIIFNPFFWS